MFAALFALAGGASVVVFILLHEEAFDGDMVGRRTEMFVLLGPLVFLTLAVVAIVRGIRAFPTWTAYRSATSPEQRRAHRDLDLRGRNPVTSLVLGVLGAAGFALFLAGFVGWALRGFEDVQSSVLIFEFMMICLLFAVAGLGSAGTILASRRRARLH